MKVIVMGSGVVGATTAWMLAEAGIDTIVVDRQSSAANETSKGNACLVMPGHSLVWNHPGAPLDHLKSMLQSDPVSSIKLLGNPGIIPWAARFLASCRKSVSARNTLLNLQLARRSAGLTRQIIEQQGLDVGLQTNGSLYWHESKAALELERGHCEFLNSQGVRARIIEADELTSFEPALARSQRELAGALHVEDDFSADCRQFAVQLLERAVNLGKVRVVFDNPIHSIESNGTTITGIDTADGRLQADHYVLSLGPESGRMAKPLGLTLPIAPAKGYSLTVPVRTPAQMPRHGGADLTEFVAVTPLKDRLRITSYASFEGFDQTWKKQNFFRHRRVVEEVFPGLVDWEGEQNEWTGLRPMTPDGLPVIGNARPYDNLWLNTGHGFLGWTQAAASAQVLLHKITRSARDDCCSAFDLRWG
ncbi:MAG: FAD-dependent oxidoreductase [Gammaproteobacteria bacterium]|nr:FAD-dependent oxidoreductase [Gammaproteobacteria bacterium]